MDWMPQAIRDGIIVVLIISGPVVLAAAGIGLAIGILQAATQVQEQTIGSALKIIGVFAIIIIAGFWMFQYLNQYTSRTLTTAFTVVPHRTQKVVPADAKEDEAFNNQFEDQLLKVEPPEKIETNFPEAGLPPGVPYVGRPAIPKIPPSASKLLPPESPKIPSQPVIMPNIPISDFQEPISIPQNKTNNEQEENFPPLNLVPGNPTKQQIINPDLWQREETFSKNTKNETTDNSNEEVLPSWLE